ncbi:tRNA dihydrouridine synthase DusB [Kocuria rhizophila]|uniref:tRNA dihydrouridine synthase DusB n=1 Tax=Kocuria rhizophila TaxID=72000 RepID=UPI001EF59EE2|nr:tRNA dihydrouridine synthase DusB [Kocuria rhizophila]MCG7425272.1 tRNA dihydrouridine synthase DusB [Kocuria rhizophila]MCT1456815.1 tRNA dihydrouridine synthase DusB [Kocuria rhizophila]MCT2249679.1 tRNA dihydrouridine synthase DusB [Kocuria rhizophila]
MSTETTETADREPAVLNLKPLHLGPLTIDVPVVLAPMAGVTNKSFRKLCREYGGGLYVTEMVTARALVERRPESLRIIHHDPDETPRSIQIYGVDAVNVGKAVRMVAQEDRADHIDLNFGCPVPKVTKRGGGSALPWKTDLFRAIVSTAVREAGDIPVTVKMRIGIDDEHQTYLDAGRMARDEGVAAVALHGRTLEQHYSGTANWDAIARLREALPDIPVLGNGDIFSAEDAVRMVEHTGVDGVVVGRGCQGRPWLFGDLQAAFEGSPRRFRPGVRKVADTVYRHAELLTEEFGDEAKGCREIRKHVSWYFKGYPVGGELRAKMAQVPDLAALRELLGQLDLDAPYPGADVEGPRGRAGSPKKPHLPDGWLSSRILGDAERLGLVDAELDVSGG